MVAFQDMGALGNKAAEQIFIGILSQGDPDEGDDRKAHRSRIGLDREAPEGAGGTQTLDPFVHTGRGEANGIAEIRQRPPGILGEELDDFSVDVVHGRSFFDESEYRPFIIRFRRKLP